MLHLRYVTRELQSYGSMLSGPQYTHTSSVLAQVGKDCERNKLNRHYARTSLYIL